MPQYISDNTDDELKLPVLLRLASWTDDGKIPY